MRKVTFCLIIPLLCWQFAFSTEVRVHSNYSSGVATLYILSKSADQISQQLSFSDYEFTFTIPSSLNDWQTIRVHQVNEDSTSSSTVIFPVHREFTTVHLYQNGDTDSLVFEAEEHLKEEILLMHKCYLPYLNREQIDNIHQALLDAIELRDSDVSILLMLGILRKATLKHKPLIDLFVDLQKMKLENTNPLLQLLVQQHYYWAEALAGAVDLEFWLYTLSGNQKLFKSLIEDQKKQYVWASWCHPCVSFIESMENRGNYYFVSIDDSLAAVLKAASRLGLNEKDVLWDKDKEILKRFNVSSIPIFLVPEPGGKVTVVSNETQKD